MNYLQKVDVFVDQLLVALVNVLQANIKDDPLLFIETWSPRRIDEFRFCTNLKTVGGCRASRFGDQSCV